MVWSMVAVTENVLQDSAHMNVKNVKIQVQNKGVTHPQSPL